MIDLDKRRIKLHKKLSALCDNVYYQTPDNFKLKYPCILYEINNIPTKGADNGKYFYKVNVNITIIEKNKTSEFVPVILSWPYTRYNNSFFKEGLNHSFMSIEI